MLKIKDNVDLKELEKFGFKYVEKIPKMCSYYMKEISVVVMNVKGISVNINSNSRCIWIEYTNGAIYFDNLDIIFDLIQVGLVEKVEEKYI